MSRIVLARLAGGVTHVLVLVGLGVAATGAAGRATWLFSALLVVTGVLTGRLCTSDAPARDPWAARQA